jgi:hypothetical protein
VRDWPERVQIGQRMRGATMERPQRVRVGIVAIPEATIGTLSGIFDVLGGLAMLAGREGVPDRSPFLVEILGETADPVRLASGITLPLHAAAVGVPSDIVIVPSLLVPVGGWRTGRYPRLCDWLVARHRAGATLCSACSGIFLIAETGLFDGIEATVHWPYARSRACRDTSTPRRVPWWSFPISSGSSPSRCDGRPRHRPRSREWKRPWNGCAGSNRTMPSWSGCAPKALAGRGYAPASASRVRPRIGGGSMPWP